MTKDILNLLNLLKQRPKLFIIDDLNCNKLKVYLVGLIQGIDLSLNIEPKLSTQIFYWLRKKIEIDYDIVWEEIILDYYKDKTDDELKIILIQTLEDFFRENPNWDK